jgi:thiamine biosynthesis lipoprotein
MGTTVHLIGVGGNSEALDRASARVHELEARWSRFRPTSELSRLNARAGIPTRVTRETYDLVAAAVDGCTRTAGLFDPTLLDAVEHLGYDRTFDELPADRRVLTSKRTEPGRAVVSAGCVGIELDPDASTVLLPNGTRLDLGGIAKGHTADLVVADLARAGLDGACANIGGDVRVWGHAPRAASSAPASWTIDVGDPTVPTGDAAPVAVLEIDDGAIVTSTRLRRRWLVNGGEHHPLVDPRTGRSASNGWAQVSVIAGTATDAEVLAKALFVGGPSPDRVELLEQSDARAVLVADDGHVETVGFGP